MEVINHVLLTRFNLPTEGVEGLVRARNGWLEKRMDLFERYCAPSVARQLSPVTWIVYLDPESPAWLMERLSGYVRSGLFRPVLRESVGRADLVHDIEETLGRTGRLLLTSNLDNDDGVAVDFSLRLRSVAARGPRTAVYLTRGLIKSPGGLYLRRDGRNAFCSVLETWDDPVTAWSEYHNELPNVMPTVRLAGAPAWLQVVHGDNVSNRVRGRLVSPEAHRDLFGDLLSDAREPRVSQRVRDGLLGRPLRGLRDRGRATARVVGLKLLGKERYQQAKLRLSSLV